MDRTDGPGQGHSGDLADVADLPAVDVRLDAFAEVVLLAGLHRSGEHKRAAGQARRLDRAVVERSPEHPGD